MTHEKAHEQAQAQVSSIVELVADLNGGDYEEAIKAIENNPLSVEYRSGWTVPGRDMAPDEYRVVLCTGGPHVELRGDIGRGDVRVVWRDGGGSGEYRTTLEELDALRQYVAVLGVHEFQF